MVGRFPNQNKATAFSELGYFHSKTVTTLMRSTRSIGRSITTLKRSSRAAGGGSSTPGPNYPRAAQIPHARASRRRLYGRNQQRHWENEGALSVSPGRSPLLVRMAPKTRRGPGICNAPKEPYPQKANGPSSGKAAAILTYQFADHLDLVVVELEPLIPPAFEPLVCPGA
jgi:hypothetical protein